MIEIQATFQTAESSLSWNNRILVPIEVAEQLILNKDRRMIAHINHETKIHCALMPEPGGYFIMVNKSIVKSLNLVDGQKVSLILEKDTSEYGMEMPEELQTFLDQDEEGSKHFHELTPGKQRNLIHLVAKVKNTDSRIKKSMAIMEHLKEKNGTLDFKMLNEKIKQFNQGLF